MSNPPIEFQKQRELGDIISDTFKFIRENFKPLFTVIFKITSPVFVILLFAIGYYSFLGMDILQNPFFEDSYSGTGLNYFIALFVLLSSLAAFYVLLYATILHYIGSYVRHNGVVVPDEVYQGVKSDFGAMLGLLILIGIITIFGFLLCFFPGIYVWAPLSIAPAIMIFKRTSVTDAISDAFSLIQNNWWSTFFSLFVITLLVYIIGMIFQFPLMVYFFIKTLTSAQEGSVANPADLIDWVYVIFNVLSSLFQYLLSSVIVVASAFIYYNLDEKKNATGYYKRISGLGTSES